MKILLKKATLIDSDSPFHFSIKDFLITDGIISAIEDEISDNGVQVIEYKNLHISKGWFDSSVSLGEPGYEERETLENGLKTAGLSGFTKIAVTPNTNPIIDNTSAVSFLKEAGKNSATDIYPIASFSKNQEGALLTEFFNLKQKGAIAFGDYKIPIANSNLLKIALQYTQRIDGLIFSYPADAYIYSKNGINEGVVSTRNGLVGSPTLSETIQIKRDLAILEYTGGKIHIPYLSSAEALELIRIAKKQNLNVSCSVPLANLLFTEEKVSNFDTNYKLEPPLRTEADCIALRQGVIDGTVDMVTSLHEPLNIELKQLEFEYATAGTIGLEAMFGVLSTLFPLEKVITILTRGQEVFQIPSHKIEVGQKANLTLFNPLGESIFKEKNILSTSKNCAFIGSQIQGITYGVINGINSLLK